MGEIADMAIEGECCQICFCDFRSPGLGYPFTCVECGGNGGIIDPLEPEDLVGCPECGKKLKGTQGVMDHMRDKHGIVYLGGGPDD